MTPDSELQEALDRFHITSQKINLAPHLVHNQVTANAVTRAYFAARQSIESLFERRIAEDKDKRLRIGEYIRSLESQVAELALLRETVLTPEESAWILAGKYDPKCEMCLHCDDIRAKLRLQSDSERKP